VVLLLIASVISAG